MKIYSEEDKTIKICNTPVSNIYELMEQLRIENKYLLLSEDEIQSLYKDSGVLLLGPKGDLNIVYNYGKQQTDLYDEYMRRHKDNKEVVISPMLGGELDIGLYIG